MNNLITFQSPSRCTLNNVTGLVSSYKNQKESLKPCAKVDPVVMSDEDSDKPLDGEQKDKAEEKHEEEKSDNDEKDDPRWRSMPNSLIVASRTLSCGICGRQGFRRPYLLKRHMKSHTGEKPFSCEVCGKKFTQQSDVKRHMRTHPLEEPQTCAVCNCTFLKFSEFDRHTKLHESPCKCDVCGKTFTQMSHLRRHVRLHTGEKPFSCGVCAKKFSQSYSLRQHTRLHTGERPYSCGVCNMEFRTSAGRFRHIQKHGSKNTFKCGICNKVFYLVNNLVEHMRIHNGEIKFKCDVCEKVFSRAWTLEKHMQLHNVQVCGAINQKTQQTTTHLTHHLMKDKSAETLIGCEKIISHSQPDSLHLLGTDDSFNLSGECKNAADKTGTFLITVCHYLTSQGQTLSPPSQVTDAVLRPAMTSDVLSEYGDAAGSVSESENQGSKPVLHSLSQVVCSKLNSGMVSILSREMDVGDTATSLYCDDHDEITGSQHLVTSSHGQGIALLNPSREPIMETFVTDENSFPQANATLLLVPETVDSDLKPGSVPVHLEKGHVVLPCGSGVACSNETASAITNISSGKVHEQTVDSQNKCSCPSEYERSQSSDTVVNENSQLTVKLEKQPSLNANPKIVMMMDKNMKQSDLSESSDSSVAEEYDVSTASGRDDATEGTEFISAKLVVKSDLDLVEQMNTSVRYVTGTNEVYLKPGAKVEKDTFLPSQHGQLQMDKLSTNKDHDMPVISSVVSSESFLHNTENYCEVSPVEAVEGVVNIVTGTETLHKNKTEDVTRHARVCLASDMSSELAFQKRCSPSQKLNYQILKRQELSETDDLYTDDMRISFSTPQKMLQQFCSMVFPVNSQEMGKCNQAIPQKPNPSFPSLNMTSPFLPLGQDIDSDTELAAPQQILTKFLPKMGQKNTKNSCDKLFPDKIPELPSDMATEQKTYRCDVCHKKMKTFFTWKEHLSIHSSERPWTCEVCGKSYRLESYVKKHMLTHTSEDDKAFLCSICGKKFATADYFKQHMRVHTGEKSFKCMVCDKSFGTSNYLKIHKSIHTGEKNLNCGVCMRSFRHPTDLKRHVQGHLRDPGPVSRSCRSYTMS